MLNKWINAKPIPSLSHQRPSNVPLCLASRPWPWTHRSLNFCLWPLCSTHFAWKTTLCTLAPHPYVSLTTLQVSESTPLSWSPLFSVRGFCSAPQVPEPSPLSITQFLHALHNARSVTMHSISGLSCFYLINFLIRGKLLCSVVLISALSGIPGGS